MGLSSASQGQFTRGPVELVEHVAEECRLELSNWIDEHAEELASLDGWRPRLKRAVAMRLELSLPWQEHRSQAIGLMTSSSSASGSEPAAVPALAALSSDLARATLEAGEPMSEARWRARRAAAAAAYALAEVRALADAGPDLADTLQFADRLVDTLGDAADAPAALRDALQAGALAGKSLGGAALSFLPPKAIGALPQILDIAANRAGSTFSFILDAMLVRDFTL